VPATLDHAIVRKAALRLVPFMGLLYVVSFLDRVNVGYAALTMNADIGLSATAFGAGAGIFFLGYFVFEIPSNLIMQRVGARMWMARILITWGLVSAAMAAVREPLTFFAARFALGVAEAGFFPGMILYLTYWFPDQVRGRIIGWFMLAIPVSNVIGGPVSTLLLDHPLPGLAGWQTMFLVEGIPAMLLGVVVLAWLPDRPASAPWLTPDERDVLEQLASRPSARSARLADGLLDGRVWLLALVYFGLVIGLYGLGFWAPQIIKAMGTSSNTTIGLLSAIPYLVAGVCMVAWGRHSDATGERRWHLVIPAWIGAAGFAASAFIANPALSLAALTAGAIGIYAALPVFWTLPTALLSGTAAAGGIALVNSLGNLGGYLGPFAVGWLRDTTGGYGGGLLVLAGSMALAGAVVLLLRNDD
jgi:ACS family tartrate transporter-like MFS transporter